MQLPFRGFKLLSAGCSRFGSCQLERYRVRSKSMKQPFAAQAPGDPLWDPEWKEGAGELTIRQRSKESDEEITLFNAWFCPYGQRAWIALEEKGAKYKYVEINTYEVDPDAPGGYTGRSLPLAEKQRIYPDFVAASPRGLVPAVTYKGDHVWESNIVAEFVDATFSGGDKLVPVEDPLKSAHIRIWSDHCSQRIIPSFYRALMEKEPEKQQGAVEQLFAEFRALSRAMAGPDSGPYFAGSKFCLVDISLAPFWQRLVQIGEHFDGLMFPDDKDFRRLQVWWEAVKERPSVKATMVSQGRLMAFLGQYTRNISNTAFSQAVQAALSKSSSS